MTATPTITLAICSRNRPDGLRIAVTAALKVLPTDAELLVIDQTEQPTLDLGAGDPRLRYEHRPGCGIALSRNTALRMASTNVVVFTDDDCAPRIGMVEAPITEQPYFLSLGPHGFYWFDLKTPPVEDGPESDRPRIVIDGDWDGLVTGHGTQQLEDDALPAFLAAQRWFGSKDATIERTRVGGVVQLLDSVAPVWVAAVTSETADAESQYAMPLAIAIGRSAQRIRDTQPASILADVEGPRGRGVLYDGLANDTAVLRLLDIAARGETVTSRAATLRGEATAALAPLVDALDETPSVQRIASEQSNSSVIIGGQVLLKVLRRIEPGEHPEVEIGRHFDRIGFRGTPRFAGAITYTAHESAPAAFAVLHELVWNQADGWTHTLGEVTRYIEEAPEHDAPAEMSGAPVVRFAEAARTLGLRTAEMHAALADARGDAAFEPEPLTESDAAALIARIESRLDGLAPRLSAIAETSPSAALVLDTMHRIGDHLRSRLAIEPDVMRIRCHGDYHLAQTLWAREDFTIIDFEGEVGLPLAERRRKTSALIDIAGMLRSFEYAAAVGLRNEQSRQAQPGLAPEQLRATVDTWRSATSSAFLDGYAEGLAASELRLVPTSRATFEAWLDTYLLDKALHEVEYELGHRPDWVDLPLAAAAALLGRIATDSS